MCLVYDKNQSFPTNRSRLYQDALRILFRILPLPTILGKAWLVEALKKFIDRFNREVEKYTGRSVVIIVLAVLLRSRTCAGTF